MESSEDPVTVAVIFALGTQAALAETGAEFSATPADCARQRPRYPISPAAKPRKVKDYSDRAEKPELRGTAWWGWQDSTSNVRSYCAVLGALARLRANVAAADRARSTDFAAKDRSG
jgi:hypothetical protein